MGKEIFIVVGVTLGFAFLLFACGIESTFLVGVLSFVVMCLIAIPIEKHAEQAKSHTKFTKDKAYSGYLTVLSRNSETRELVEVYAERDAYISYTPDEYIYTSATVGGVTTGGVSKIDGGYSVHSGSKTGKYNLFYKKAERSHDSRNITGWKGAVIHSIKLLDADFKKAENNTILKPLIISGKPNSLNVYQLSKSTANYVLSWICGEVDK